MFHKIKKYFTTTHSERKGFWFLIILITTSFTYYFISDVFYKKTKPISVDIETIEDLKKVEKKIKDHSEKLKKEEIKLFQFNPNEISEDKWQQLGFSEKQTKSILKFIEKGFVFKNKEDLKKLYVVNKEKYKQLEPYIVIPKKEFNNTSTENYRILYTTSTEPIYKGLDMLGKVYYRKENNEYKYYSEPYISWEKANQKLISIETHGFEEAFISKLANNIKLYPIKTNKKPKPYNHLEKEKITKIYINNADTTELKKIRGIGSYYANKIIDYRTKLGGFYSAEQIKEIYGIKPEVLENDNLDIIIDTNLILKININKATKKELSTHPYIKWNVANSIVLYRKNHGEYKSVKNIQDSDLVNEKLYRKIAKYLTVK